MKYFAEFDSNGFRKAGYVADGKPYSEADIRKQFPGVIEISEADQVLYITGDYVQDKVTGKPVKNPVYVPTPEELQKQKIVALDAEYQEQFAQLAQSLGLATLDGNQTVADGIKSDYATLKAEYQTKRQVIIGG